MAVGAANFYAQVSGKTGFVNLHVAPGLGNAIGMIYGALKNVRPNAIVMFNQHVQDGTKINYFPTDVVNGELVLPPAAGHNPLRSVDGTTYYLPFEYSLVTQRRTDGIKYDPLGPSCWLVFSSWLGASVGKVISALALPWASC